MPTLSPTSVPEILKLLVTLTTSSWRPDSSGDLAHNQEPLLATQPGPPVAPLTRLMVFMHAGAILRIKLHAETQQACQPY